MAWTAVTFSFGSILTSTKMTQVQDNFTAVANGDSGAPNIQTAAIANLAVTAAKLASSAVEEAKLAASAVSQSKLKTALNTISASISVTGVSVLSGGRYCSLPSAILGGGSGPDFVSWLVGGAINDGSTITTEFLQSVAAVPDVFFTVAYGSRLVEVALLTYRFNLNDASSIYVQYVAACPPYNLGNGDIPMFYYGLLNNTTCNIDVLWSAEDPPFANNGPTVINPLGRIRRLVQGTLADDSGRAAHRAALKRAHAMVLSNDPKDMAAVRAILDAPVTMEEKLRDMPLIPHPFSPKAGYTVVLLDPCGSVVEDLWLGETYGGDDAHKIIHGGKLIIDNTPCGAIAPPGVMPVNCRWKLTP